MAISDPGATIASPLQTVAVGGDCKPSRHRKGAGADVDAGVRAVADAASGFDIAAFVVGLPLDMDGGEGRQAKSVRRFGNKLAGLTGKPVYFWDEQLTTVAAEDLLRSAQVSRKKRKARIDRVAAQILLQGFLDAKGWPGC